MLQFIYTTIFRDKRLSNLTLRVRLFSRRMLHFRLFSSLTREIVV